MSSRTATPDMAMKPIAAEIENGMSRNQSAKMPPTQANGMPVKTAQRVDDVAIRAVEQAKDQHECDRHDDQQPGVRPLQILELAAVFDAVAARRAARLCSAICCRASATKLPRSRPRTFAR